MLNQIIETSRAWLDEAKKNYAMRAEQAERARAAYEALAAANAADDLVKEAEAVMNAADEREERAWFRVEDAMNDLAALTR